MNTDLPDYSDTELRVATSPDLSMTLTNQEVRDCLVLLYQRFRNTWLEQSRLEQYLTVSATLSRAMGKDMDGNIELLGNIYFRIACERIAFKFDEFMRTGQIS